MTTTTTHLKTMLSTRKKVWLSANRLRRYPTTAGFGAPIWRRTLVLVVGGGLFYEYLGSPETADLPWAPAVANENVTNIGATRAAREAGLIEERQLVRSATKQPVYRTRNPEEFNHSSAYNRTVGMNPVANAHLGMLPLLLLAAASAHASLPLVDFDRMGKVGLAGAFAGLDLFSNNSLPFDDSVSTLFSRATNGSLERLASSDTGGSIVAACALNDVVYFAGSFSSIGSTTASNIASYTPSSDTFAALGSGGPNGAVDALFCDSTNSKVWAGGSFTSPGTSVAVWDTKASSWSAPPFKGLSGGGGRVFSITTNASDSSLFFAGSFVTSFVGNGSATLNGTNNPNVPFSAGATPFSSSLVPIPIPASAVLQPSSSSSDAGFGNITVILCPAGADGAGNSWFGADGTTSVITIDTHTFLSANGLRLGNTFQPNHGTTGFSVTTLPDATVRTLSYLDPTTNTNKTCSNPCPLLTDSSILYQDFLFADAPLSITGVEIQLTGFTGDGPGLHILQLLSSGAFASAVNSENGPSCFAPEASNTTFTGTWQPEQAGTGISGTVQNILVAKVSPGTSPSTGPTFTWNPYVSAAGEYTMNMLVPGCTELQDCSARTSVNVTVFPGNNLQPWVTTISQQNTADSSTVIYQGPILPTAPDFITTVHMSLAAAPSGAGDNGKFDLIANKIQLVLNSAGVNGSFGANATGSTSSTSTHTGFGFFEWPLAQTATSDATTTLANSSETALDAIGLDIFNAAGGSSSLTSSSSTSAIVAVAHHPSGVIFLGGNFSLSSGAAAASGNIVSFKSGGLVTLSANGLNGPVTSLVLDGDVLYVGGSFTDTKAASMNGQLHGVASYNVQSNQWATLDGGVDGSVASLSVDNGQVQVAGKFTTTLTSSGSVGAAAAGLATWDIASSQWANSGGFIVGSMTLVTNGTSSGAQIVAGNIVASQTFGASGMVMVKNSGNDLPDITPLGVALEADVSAASSNTSAASRKRAVRHHATRIGSTWLSALKLPTLFARQSTSPAPLPAALPAPAPAVLAGAFWTNSSSSDEVAIIGGNFSFASYEGIALYDTKRGVSSGLPGAQVNGTVRALLVVDDTLYVGGEFTIPGLNANGFAVYDLQKQQWNTSSVQALQGSSGSVVVVRSITTSAAEANTVVVAGSFAQAGSLPCQAICLLNTNDNQWNALGSGVQGEVSAVSYAGSNDDYLIASGSLALSDNTAANVAQYTFANASWISVGSGSSIPGPVTAVEVNAGNVSSIFAAGISSDSSSSFLSFWNGETWTTLSSTLESNTTVAQLAMVPLQDTHSANSIIQSDRMLMISGSLADSSFGNASSVLYDGQSFFPYIVSSTASGAAGAINSLFFSFSTFSFTQHKFLATGIVILISIAIAAGVVFLLALIGILWTLFSRRDDKATKFDAAEEDDDDSTHHRPSSLLEHINAATRTTIIGAPFGFSAKEDKQIDSRSQSPEQDPFGPDASNYMRAETPSDAFGGVLAEEEKTRPAQARYSFDGAGEGELPMSAGAQLEILDDRDPAWWYVRDVKTGAEGVAPAAYLWPQ
ncbi:SH3 domain-containing protein [Mycena chlorophos]|uniref:SH3 domain-containing protein n=1 Tax=Mycena chlorophos TaxID=658473 RepID=A0A8H6SEQ1_MYCCL|nr:SH3 domain-containing protein [Mycena chlorophos]